MMIVDIQVYAATMLQFRLEIELELQLSPKVSFSAVVRRCWALHPSGWRSELVLSDRYKMQPTASLLGIASLFGIRCSWPVLINSTRSLNDIGAGAPPNEAFDCVAKTCSSGNPLGGPSAVFWVRCITGSVACSACDLWYSRY